MRPIIFSIGNVYKICKNIHEEIDKALKLDVDGIDPVSLVSADKVVMTVDAVKKVQEWLG